MHKISTVARHTLPTSHACCVAVVFGKQSYQSSYHCPVQNLGGLRTAGEINLDFALDELDVHVSAGRSATLRI